MPAATSEPYICLFSHQRFHAEESFLQKKMESEPRHRLTGRGKKRASAPNGQTKLVNSHH
jgi:hypothetical protein